MAEADEVILAKVKVRVRIRGGVPGSVMVGFQSPKGEIPAFISQEDVHVIEGNLEDGTGEVWVTVLKEKEGSFVADIPGESPLRGSRFEITRASSVTA